MRNTLHRNSRKLLLTAISFVLIAAGGASFTTTSYGEGGGSALPGPVDPSQVCMVNDAVMGKDQIPVQFEGKTYYGCCAGCVETIKTDKSVRYSTDPVTGKTVDKATSFIVMGPRGEAIYFESEETARKFLSKSSM